VLVVAGGCVAAGWWQATRALSGNKLSWVYSIEWPIFAIIAVVAWWLLIHEDPEAYRARKQKDVPGGATAPVSSGGEGRTAVAVRSPATSVTVDTGSARLATSLVLLLVVQLGLGIATSVFVPFGWPGGWAPPRGALFFIAHAVVGLLLVVGALVLLARTRRSTRLSRISGWTGAVGVGIAGLGGVLAVSHPLRLPGMGLMTIGLLVAAFGFLIPALERLGD
jgi:hypothetical protein